MKLSIRRGEGGGGGEGVSEGEGGGGDLGLGEAVGNGQGHLAVGLRVSGVRSEGQFGLEHGLTL